MKGFCCMKAIFCILTENNINIFLMNLNDIRWAIFLLFLPTYLLQLQDFLFTEGGSILKQSYIERDLSNKRFERYLLKHLFTKMEPTYQGVPKSN